ncbi:hypothetical protein V2G26_020481 [Clonostachys chloroleuca]
MFLAVSLIPLKTRRKVRSTYIQPGTSGASAEATSANSKLPYSPNCWRPSTIHKKPIAQLDAVCKLGSYAANGHSEHLRIHYSALTYTYSKGELETNQMEASSCANGGGHRDP